MVTSALERARALRARWRATPQRLDARRSSRPPTSGSSPRPRRTSDGRAPQPRRRRLRADRRSRRSSRATRTSCARHSRRSRSAPRARWRGSTTLHLSRIQIFDELVYQGPPQRPETLKRAATCCSRARSTASSTRTSTRSARASAPRPTVVGSLRRLPGQRRPAAFRRWIRDAQGRQPACSPPPTRARRVPDVRESLALRERVVDFAAAAQGLDAAALRERFLVSADCADGGALRPDVPRRARRRRRDIDLADIQGNVLRGYTLPVARRTCSCASTTSSARGALLTRMLPQVSTARAVAGRRAGDRAARRVHLRRAAGAGGARRDPRDASRDEFREGMAARAERLGDRGPSAPEHWEAGLGTGEAHVLVTVYAVDQEQLERRARRRCAGVGATRGAIDARPRAARRGAARAARDHFGFYDGIAQPAIEGSGVRAAARATASPTARGGWRDVRTGEFLHGYVDEDGALPAAPAAPFDRNGDVRRLPQAAHGRRRASGATSPTTCERTPAARSCWRPRSSGAGATARRSRARPSGRTPRSPPTRRASTTSPSPTTRTGLRCPVGAHIRRANPRDAEGFFDGRLSNRHRIIRRGRPYGPAAARRRDRGRRRRPRPGLRLLQRQHLAPVRDHPGAVDRRRRPVRARRRQGLPHRPAATATRAR